MKHNKGDILKGRKGSDAIHPIIFLKGHDDSFFIGAMITHSSSHQDNILMSKKHFNELGQNGRKFRLYFDNSHLVEAKLLKKIEWQPFTKVGELSTQGIAFVEKNLKNRHPKVWEDYLKNKIN